MTKPTKFSRNYEAIDPLGEIRKHANELFVSAGSPSDRGWEDFFDSAEQALLSGKRGEATRPPQSRVKNTSNETEATFSPQQLEAINAQNDLLLSLLAEVFPAPLVHHECSVLASLLQQYAIVLKSGEVIGPTPRDKIAFISSFLAGEYDAAFLETNKASNPLTIPASERKAYWIEKLHHVHGDERPLSYSDRNTFLRLKVTLEQSSKVSKLDFRAAN